MDIKKIRALTQLMNDNDLVQLEVESDDMKVRLSKRQDAVAALPQALPMAAAQAPAPAAAAPADPLKDDFAGCSEVTSPIPGTFYAKPNPDAPLFVHVGDRVQEGQVLCLVEAMKVFNEIKAERSGEIRKICVEDGQAVEYGTILFLVS
ncbi:MAG: acetyl-CoA carboxylase biotin carboxyl carrier protein [Planctomycetota bacterium]